MDAVSQNRSLAFMPLQIRSNPLVSRLLRKPSRLKWIWWMIGIISVATFISMLFPAGNSFLVIMVIVGFIALIVNPIFGAMTAANLVAQAVNSDTYELLCLTTLSNAKLVQGHVFAVLYRLRLPLIFILGLAPTLIGLVTTFAYTDYFECQIFNATNPQCSLPSALQVAGWFAFGCFLILASFAILAFGIALGTALGLWWRNYYIASPVTALIVIPLIVGFIILLNAAPYEPGYAPSLIYALPYVLLMAALAYGLLRAAQWVVRQRQ